MTDLTMTTNELVTLNDNNTPVTDSLKVAEYFGKDHKHVMRDIRDLVKRGVSSFGPSSYINSQNKSQPMFVMDRNAWMLLVFGFNGDKALEVKQIFVDAFNKMEATLMKQQNAFIDPTKLTRLEILQMALESEQKAVMLEAKVKEDAPKVEAYDDFLTREGLLSYTDGLKSVGLKPKCTIAWMRNNGYLNKERGVNLPRQSKIRSG